MIPFAELRLRARAVLPVPPRDPGPLLDDPAAPVYDYVPLRAGDGYTGWAEARPDPLVFGPPGSGGLQNRAGGAYDGLRRSCDWCGAGWRGETDCWACEGTG